MTKKLFVSAITKFTAGVILLALLLFLPAGTIHYPGGWLLMGILFIPMFLAGLVMMEKNPNLLRSRLNAKEKEREQDQVIKLSVCCPRQRLSPDELFALKPKLLKQIRPAALDLNGQLFVCHFYPHFLLFLL